MNIGVLGGTFDPIHNGHLIVAKEVRNRLDMAVIMFVPAGQPWLKTVTPVSPVEHRVNMVRLAIGGKPHLKISTIEVDRPGNTYTVDTMAELQAQLGTNHTFFFVLGWDNLPELPQWKEPSRLIGMCYLVAVPRPGYSRPDLEALEARIPGLSQRVIVIDRPEVDISATEIRHRVAQGLPISHLVPEPVERYIKEHKLYL